MDRINRWLRENFGYSKKEMNGAFVLFLLIWASFAAIHAFDYYKYATNEYSPEKDLDVLAKWAAELKWDEKTAEEPDDSSEEELYFRPRPFDPNSISRDELLSMNLPSYLASNWSKYVASGGKFFKKADVLKLYGMDSATYEALVPYLTIEERSFARNEPARTKADAPAEKRRMIDINVATAEELQTVRGIGPAFSKRIVKYRTALGGFHNRSQLHEVYGLPDSTADAVWQKFALDSTLCCQKIAVNAVSLDSLRRQPYLSYNQARAIIAYRDQHGPLADWYDLAEIKVIPDSTIQKLKPYFDF